MGDARETARLEEAVRRKKFKTSFPRKYEVVHYIEDPDALPFAPPRREHWRTDKQAFQKGGQGQIFMQTCISGAGAHNQRAVKKIALAQDAGGKKRYDRELRTITKFCHVDYSSHFVQLLGWYETNRSLYIAMEYLKDGDLHSYLKARQDPLPEADCCHIIRQVVHGLDIMHDDGYSHGDIKPENILIKNMAIEGQPHTWLVKLADFGISKRALDISGATTLVGTLEYMAPELKPGTPAADLPKADMWSVGVMAYRMLTRESVFPSSYQQYKYCERPDVLFPLAALLKREVSEDGRRLLRALMAPEPQQRPSSAEVRRDVWLQVHQLERPPSENDYESDSSEMSEVGSHASTRSDERDQFTKLSTVTELTVISDQSLGPDTNRPNINSQTPVGDSAENTTLALENLAAAMGFERLATAFRLERDSHGLEKRPSEVPKMALGDSATARFRAANPTSTVELSDTPDLVKRRSPPQAIDYAKLFAQAEVMGIEPAELLKQLEAMRNQNHKKHDAARADTDTYGDHHAARLPATSEEFRTSSEVAAFRELVQKTMDSATKGAAELIKPAAENDPRQQKDSPSFSAEHSKASTLSSSTIMTWTEKSRESTTKGASNLIKAEVNDYTRPDRDSVSPHNVSSHLSLAGMRDTLPLLGAGSASHSSPPPPPPPPPPPSQAPPSPSYLKARTNEKLKIAGRDKLDGFKIGPKLSQKDAVQSWPVGPPPPPSQAAPSAGYLKARLNEKAKAAWRSELDVAGSSFESPQRDTVQTRRSVGPPPPPSQAPPSLAKKASHVELDTVKPSPMSPQTDTAQSWKPSGPPPPPPPSKIPPNPSYLIARLGEKAKAAWRNELNAVESSSKSHQRDAAQHRRSVGPPPPPFRVPPSPSYLKSRMDEIARMATPSPEDGLPKDQKTILTDLHDKRTVVMIMPRTAEYTEMAKKINWRIYGHVPSLADACLRGDERAVSRLINEGADLEEPAWNGQTALAFAAEAGNALIIETLILHGAKVDSTSNEGKTPLFWAAAFPDNTHALKALVKHGASIEHRTLLGQTPLSWAATCGRTHSMKELMARGARIEVRSNDGKSPLAWAATYGQYEAVELLDGNGADLESQSNNMYTPLLWAMEKGHESTTDLLLRLGAKLDTDKRLGTSAVFRALELDDMRTMHRLFDRHPEMLEERNQIMQTPLGWAAEHGLDDLVTWLLGQGADVESRSNNGQTPLSRAAAHGTVQTAQELLWKGADMETRSCNGQTPLSWAAMYGKADMVVLLLNHGARPSTRSRNGQTPLDWAMEKGQGEIVNVLGEWVPQWHDKIASWVQ